MHTQTEKGKKEKKERKKKQGKNNNKKPLQQPIINEVRKESVMYMLIYTSNILFSYAIGYGYIFKQLKKI